MLFQENVYTTEKGIRMLQVQCTLTNFPIFINHSRF